MFIKSRKLVLSIIYVISGVRIVVRFIWVVRIGRCEMFYSVSSFSVDSFYSGLRWNIGGVCLCKIKIIVSVVVRLYSVVYF